MIIDCIADLHGHRPKLEGGDLLIIAGDSLATNDINQWHIFASWMNGLNYKKIIFIAGNHDTVIERWDKEQVKGGYKGSVSDPADKVEYLCDSGTQVTIYPDLKPEPEGLVYTREDFKVWGSPWSLKFEGMNPHCRAFTGTEVDLEQKYALIPEDIDILVTHTPPYRILDWKTGREGKRHLGSTALRSWLTFKGKPKLHVFGHIHEAYGIQEPVFGYCSVNASILDEDYIASNKPIRIIL